MERITLKGQQDNIEQYQTAVKLVEEAIKDWTSSKWAQELSDMLPMWELEMHLERWIEGIDSVLYSIEQGTVFKTPFGRYADFTAHTLNEMEKRAIAVKKWHSDLPAQTALEEEISAKLGKHDPHKDEAAQAFIEITQSFVEGGFDKNLSEKWRARSPQNPVLQSILQGEGLDRGINDGGGYWLINKLDMFIGVIGGYEAENIDIEASCNVTLRHVFRDDRQRVDTSKGYLIGLSAYLEGKNAGDIREKCPELAGYAIKVLRCLRKSRFDKAEVSLIARKLFLLIRYWYIRALNFAVPAELREEDYLLPEVPPL